MAAIVESLLALFLVALAGGGSAAGPIDAAADLRLPILSSTVTGNGSSDLDGVVRWQQPDEVPSDLPDDTEELDQPIVQVEPGDAEPLDAPLAEAEPLDAELGKGEPLDPAVAVAEPLDAPLDEAAAEPILEATDPAPRAPAAPASAAVAPTVDSKRTPALPPDFGRGETIVRNPPAGVTAEVPTDCERVLEHGRAVIGLNCGDDDGPWWLSQVGHHAPPAHPSPSIHPAAPVVEQPPLQARAVIVSPPAVDDDAGDGEVIGHSTVTVGQETVRVPNVSNVERITIDRSGGRVVENDRGGDGNRATATSRGGRVTGLNQLSSAQAAKKGDAKKPKAKRSDAKQGQAQKQKKDKSNKGKATKGKAKKSPCAVAKQKAKADVSKKQLAKHQAKCKQYKKAKSERRAGIPMIHSRLA